MNNTILNSYSGIKTHQFGLDSVSNNIANVNTTGYRESRPEFETLFAPQRIGGTSPTSNEINLGVSASSNAISTKNGSYKASGGEFDLAYQGKGWFVVGENKEGEMEVKKDGLTQKQNNYFTRDGSFGKDAQGYLVNHGGYYVYGVNLGKIKEGVFISSPNEDEKNLASNKLSPLQIPQGLEFKPLETTEASLAIQLNQKGGLANAYGVFVQQGQINEEELDKTDLSIFATKGNLADFTLNHQANITLTDKEGQSKTYTFNYGKEGENTFKTFGELKTLIKEQTGLDLKPTILKADSQNPSLGFELVETSFRPVKIKVDGSFFDALGMSGNAEEFREKIASYNPTQTYIPNELVSYLGITFRKIGQSGGENPLNDPKGWEIVDTQKVKAYDANQTYQTGEVVKREGNIYLLDQNNEFLKIGEEKTFSFPTFNPSEEYEKNTLVQYQNKLYQRIGEVGNSNPAEDQTSWKEIPLPSFSSNALEVPHASSSLDIYDKNGKKYHLISQYNLANQSNQEQQTWEVTSHIQDISTGQKIGQEVKHSISFDQNNQPNAPKVELDFLGQKISYDISGTGDKKSSNEAYAPPKVLEYSQNGNAMGILEETSIDENGVISLRFSNGKQEAMGRIGIVAFSNDQGLSKAGGNLFGLESTLIGGEKQLKSGNPILGWEETGRLTLGNIKQGYLETSNVEVGNALTELILMQRGYSMNAKSFTTGDEMIKEAINLKK